MAPVGLAAYGPGDSRAVQAAMSAGAPVEVVHLRDELPLLGGCRLNALPA